MADAIDDGDTISIDGQPFEFEYSGGLGMAGNQVDIYNQGIFGIPADGGDNSNGTGVIDGTMFAVDDDAAAGPNLPVLFEFDSDGVFVDADADMIPDNVLIIFRDENNNNPSTQEEIGRSVAVAISTNTSVTAIYAGDAEVGRGAAEI